MKLPNALNAFVDIRKLVDYVLDPTNIRGNHKARVMKAALGISRENAEELIDLILLAIKDSECEITERDFYGQRYSVDCKIVTEDGEAIVRSNWIVRRDEDFPRLTSCFVKKERMK